MKNESFEWYLKALEAYDGGLIPKDKIETYAKYLQERKDKEKTPCLASKNT